MRSMNSVLAVVATALLLCAGCHDKYRRTAPIAASVVEIVKSADSVEVFQVGESLKDSTGKLVTDIPESDRVLLPGGHYFLANRLAVLAGKPRRKFEKLLLDPHHYSTGHANCILVPSCGIKYTHGGRFVVVLFFGDCFELEIVDDTGARLDGGLIEESSRSDWKRALEGCGVPQ